MLVNAYYFRQHMYTLVPRHLRDDLAWMADVGTRAVSVAVLEQDLFAAQANLDILFQEAARVGLQVYAVPSRWGGLVAGSPKVPSIFASKHPETWMLNRDGSPRMGSFGPMCSVHHPATFEFFAGSLEQLLRGWPFAGIVWDELKGLRAEDYSPAALEKMPPDAPLEWHTDGFVGFFDRLGAEAKSLRPEVRLAMFVYGHIQGYALERCAGLEHLDDFGCDGRPWSLAHDSPPDPHEEAEKSLLDQAPRFFAAAERHGKRPLMLIENHNMDETCFELMDCRLPDVLNLGAEHLLYYYYPRNVSDPDRQMAILAKHLKALRAEAPA